MPASTTTSTDPIAPLPTMPSAPMPLPELESELLGLAGHIAAAECRFLQLLAEFDERGGWTGIGVRSCAHWLAWRAGMSLRTANEHLRVAHALSELPRITAAFAAGRLSYSKVRAITRVTGSETAMLTRIATTTGSPATTAAGTDDNDGAAPAPDLAAHPVAGPHASTEPAGRDTPHDTAETGGTAGPGGTAGAAPTPSTPPGSAAPRETDSGTGAHRSTGTGHADTPDGDGDGAGDEDGAGDGDGAGDEAATDPTPSNDPAPDPGPDPEVAEQVLLNLALSGTASHVETVVRAVRRRTTRPVDTAARRGLTWHHDADGSVVVRGRFTPEDGAALIAAIDSRLPAPIPSPDPDAAPPEDLDQRGLEQEPGSAVDRLAARRGDALLELARHHDDATGPVVARGSAQVVVHVDVSTGTARIAGGPEIAGATAERLACDARARILLDDRATNRLYLGRSRRLATPAQIAALTARDTADGGGCRFPGCGHTRHLHAHHVLPWLRGGPTDIDNLVLLCGHHHRLVHEHGYRIRLRENGHWEFRRPDGGPVAPSGEPLTGSAEALVEINTRAGLEIDRGTLTPDWYGDRLDPEPILDALLPTGVPASAAA